MVIWYRTQQQVVPRQLRHLATELYTGYSKKQVKTQMFKCNITQSIVFTEAVMNSA